MNLQDVLPHPGTPMRESHPATPEAGQYNSPDVDNPEEVAQHKAESWLSACSESLTDTTAFHIVTGRQKLRWPWPKAMSLNESRSPCSRQWRVWLKTMQPI